MDWGMKNRISRIIKPKTGRCVMLAVDHGYFQGPTTGLRDLGKTVNPLLPYADALMITRGAIKTWIPAEADIPIILRVSGGQSILKELSNEIITTSIEDAIRINASAITCSAYVGGEYEKQTLENLSKIVDEGNKYGIPVLAVTAVGKDLVRDARYLGLASRICVELGAHMVKTYYTENFSEVVEACGSVPVVIAGGKKQPEKEALEMAHSAISAGATGVDMGRNIFQSDSPIGMIKAVRAVVHDKKSVDEAYAIYEKEKKKNGEKSSNVDAPHEKV
ncbi:MAG: 3-hydroxy-5-phosphonooxypentane-2,4-dione thiolase [Nanoarchaeota archaeon]|nr:3-hydroxy-5-phosphonooxypentane-2,4-dione thiolase [Nanoarchaeota archaeon]MBU4300169.1 3-hydroxy-5-phosphonooxypentane-2,4-dione thiolase [Nanoarchaeota archaeon]MBU4452205.1 3-hydroxy-5-phosphonooxypentane-2,4-dione thiolase [Nanoarchaeota archaeon]MCG2724375.1 3-hydroxy-5-phosphonooxypentane-2,4-dione thiolase [archaeon]